MQFTLPIFYSIMTERFYIYMYKSLNIQVSSWQPTIKSVSISISIPTSTTLHNTYSCLHHVIINFRSHKLIPSSAFSYFWLCKRQHNRCFVLPLVWPNSLSADQTAVDRTGAVASISAALLGISCCCRSPISERLLRTIKLLIHFTLEQKYNQDK